MGSPSVVLTASTWSPGRRDLRPRLALVGFSMTALVAGSLLAGAAATAAPTPGTGPAAGGTAVTVPVPGADSFIQIVAGYAHSLALDAGGHLWTWGADSEGQLGNGTPTGNVTAPARITPGTAYAQVAAGFNHSLALDSDGDLWTWGWNHYGQLGNGAPSGVVATPTQVATSTTFTAVAAGFGHSVALDTDGDLWAWGHNIFGQVGSGAPSANVTAPTQITTGTKFTSIAAGGHHSLALDTDGNLWSWGDDGEGQAGNGATGSVPAPAQINTGATYTAIAAGRYHSLALDADGDLWTWGADTHGQVGNGAPTGDVTTPEQITTAATYTHIAAGFAHSLALDTAGNLWTWGDDGSGQLGNGTGSSADVTTPEQITTATTYAHVAAGFNHSLALDSDGELWTWGSGSAGRLGNGALTGDVTAPEQITAATTYAAVAAGRYHSLALDTDGSLWTWGADSDGQLGNGAPTAYVTTPAQITTATTYTHVAAGRLHSLALDTDGNLWAWGDDGSGQLGNGTGSSADVTAPAQVTATATYTHIAAGADHSLALDTAGNLWAWGNNSYGQVGNGTTTGPVTAPTQITTATTYTHVAAGRLHSLALDTAGNLWAWGNDLVGQLGNGTTAGDVTTPTQITTATTYTHVAAGYYHSVALDTAGNLWAWGDNIAGEVGNGTTAGPVTTPAQITTATTYTHVAAGYYHSVALDTAGNLWAWGDNHSGKVGNGTTTGPVTTPEQITTATTHTNIAAGADHSVALDTAGNLWTWGSGPLGNGTTTGPVTAPARIGGTTTITGIAFDGVPGTGLQRISETRALVTTPPGTPGPATITIHYSYDGDPKPTLTLTQPFTYLAPPPPPPPGDGSGGSGSGGSSSGGSSGGSSSGGSGYRASSITADVGQPPTISLQPTDVTAEAGDAFILTVAITGDTLSRAQWQQSTDDGATWTDLDGETGWSLTRTAAEELDGTRYRVVLTNEYGATISESATLTVLSPAEDPAATPAPTAQAPTASDEPDDGTQPGIPAWLWVAVGIVLLLLIITIGVALTRRRA